MLNLRYWWETQKELFNAENTGLELSIDSVMLLV